MFELFLEMLDPLGALVMGGGMIAFLLWQEKRYGNTTTRRKEPTKCGRRNP